MSFCHVLGDLLLLEGKTLLLKTLHISELGGSEQELTQKNTFQDNSELPSLPNP